MAYDILEKGARKLFKTFTLEQISQWLAKPENWADKDDADRRWAQLTKYTGGVVNPQLQDVSAAIEQWILNLYSWRENLWQGASGPNQQKGREFKNLRERIRRVRLGDDVYHDSLQTLTVAISAINELNLEPIAVSYMHQASAKKSVTHGTYFNGLNADELRKHPGIWKLFTNYDAQNIEIDCGGIVKARSGAFAVVVEPLNDFAQIFRVSRGWDIASTFDEGGTGQTSLTYQGKPTDFTSLSDLQKAYLDTVLDYPPGTGYVNLAPLLKEIVEAAAGLKSAGNVVVAQPTMKYGDPTKT